jgi:hypothetical protein
VPVGVCADGSPSAGISLQAVNFGRIMGNRNRYGFNKRAKELKKKKKADDKRERKLAKKRGENDGVDPAPSEEPEDQREGDMTPTRPALTASP